MRKSENRWLGLLVNLSLLGLSGPRREEGCRDITFFKDKVID